jgi:hypothetical protein
MPDELPDWMKRAIESTPPEERTPEWMRKVVRNAPPEPSEKIPWWDGRSQLPDSKTGCWGLLWEFLKLGIVAFTALAISGGKSCDLSKPPPPEPVRQLPWER